MVNVTFIGLGQMGSAMAANLIRQGYQLTVYDINPQAIEQLVNLGAKGADSPAAAAQQADFVITMLPNGELVRQVLFTEAGVVTTLPKTALIIDMSTIHPLQSDQLSQQVQKCGLSFMDAPVGRTSDHAIAGTLLILAGGTAKQIEQATPILLCMGSELVDAGGPGMGIRLKLINNFMSIALNVLSAETTVLCESLGLTLDKALEVMANTPAGKGHFTTTWPDKVLKGDVSPAFMIDLAHKDLSIALDVANQLHVPMYMGAAAREIYSQARAAGRGRQDWSAILQQLRTMASI